MLVSRKVLCAVYVAIALVALIATLEAAWTAIRANHPELPPVVVIVAGGDKVPNGIKLGHFHANRWTHREAGTVNALAVGADAAKTYAEILICGETLARQPHEIMATLLGEAAHALGHARGIKTSSRQGRWANGRFAKLATEVGITTEPNTRCGRQITGQSIRPSRVLHTKEDPELGPPLTPAPCRGNSAGRITTYVRVPVLPARKCDYPHTAARSTSS